MLKPAGGSFGADGEGEGSLAAQAEPILVFRKPTAAPKGPDTTASELDAMLADF